MIILGIDPGTATTGFGIIKKDSKRNFAMLDFGIIKTNPKDSPSKRLQKIFEEISFILKKTKPDLVVVEKLYFFKNLKTAMPVAEARGVILLAIQQNKFKIIELTPLEVKMGICGYGRAEKQQVQKMVKETLKLEKIPRPDDAADALALAICGALKATCKSN
ncbi:MAG: crossover junction endodeoxyribonuclease RuvC [Candidatus Pacebacteria bacterium]|nr:crossover junction endodeoxyribonuclease RuvC [Candidatus Paceibacterota bacterium]